ACRRAPPGSRSASPRGRVADAAQPAAPRRTGAATGRTQAGDPSGSRPGAGWRRSGLPAPRPTGRPARRAGDPPARRPFAAIGPGIGPAAAGERHRLPGRPAATIRRCEKGASSSPEPLLHESLGYNLAGSAETLQNARRRTLVLDLLLPRGHS